MEAAMIEEKSSDSIYNGEYCRVHFRVRSETVMGQSVAVSGSTYQLGYFDKEKVVQLVTSPESYPVWYTLNPVVLPRNQLVHYKFCIMEGGSMRAFESNSNRTFMPDECDTVIEGVFNPGNLAGSGVDSEMNLLAEINTLTTKTNIDADESDRVLAKELAGKRMIIVCYHLPIVVKRTSDPSKPFVLAWGESLIAKSEEASVSSTMETFWMGTVSIPGGELSESERVFLVAALVKMNCLPVFLDADIARAAYHGYCKQVMWPIFHNVDQLDSIHAAWRLKKPKSNSPVPGKKVGGIAVATASGDGSLQSTSSLRSRSPESTSPLRQDQGSVPKGLGMERVQGPQGRGHEEGKGEEGDKRGGVRGREGQAVTEEVGVGAEEQKEEETQRTVRWNHGGKGDKYHESFVSANETFLQSVIPHIKEDDVVWVHDYHLMLLPKLLRDAGLKISIVFYLHLPFPTSQIFRALPSATELLQSMTCADVVGFHAFDHARHFLNATKRMLGIRSHTTQGGMISLALRDREVIVTMSHVSIEPSQIARAVADPEVQKSAAALRAKYAGKKIIVGVDVCQRLSGQALKLAAFEKLLTDYTNAMGTVVLVQRCLRPGSAPEDEATTSADIGKMVNGLNARYAREGGESTPSADGIAAPHVLVDYEEVPSLSLSQRVALWLAADVFLLTTVREGLNLYPLEYICSRRHLENAGVVVASEFSTVSSLLSGSLKINPFYALHVADTLDKALCMTPKECDNRRQRDITFVTSHPSSLWTKEILTDLVFLKKQQAKEEAKNKDVLGQARVGIEPLPEPLDAEYLISCYEKAKSVGISSTGTRAFVFDYGGTLLHKEKFDIYIKQTLSAISGRRPTESMMEAVRKLSDDPHNAVMVVTGLTKMKMGDTFSDMLNVTLATSNGLVYSWGRNLLTAEEWEAQRRSLLAAEEEAERAKEREKEAARESKDSGTVVVATPSPTPSAVAETSSDGRTILTADSEEGVRKWDFLDFNIDWLAVRNIAMPLITKFTFRTNGTCLSPRIPGIGWSYFGADPDWSERQATQLKIELEASLANFDVKIVSHIQGSIEVVPKLLNKGVIVQRFMERLVKKRAGRLPVFSMVIGDEQCDDKMFEAMFQAIGDMPAAAGHRELRTFTVCVGRRATPADFFASDVKDIEAVLGRLANSQYTVAP